MELTHSFTVPTSVDDAWDLFMDLEKVGGCFPGATVTDVNDDGFSGTVKVKLGPIALLYTGSGPFAQRDDVAHHAVIEAKGKDKRGNGTAGATVTIQLTGAEGGTRADVVTDLAVTGKPAQFGRGVMQDVSDKLLQQFVACIEKQLTGPPAAPEAERAPEGTAAAAETAAPAPAAAAAAVASAPSTGYVETGSDALAADTSSVAASSAAPATAASQVASAPRRVTEEVEEEALDLGSAVMPVLIQRYAGYAAAAAIGVIIGWLIGRRGD